MNKDGFLLEVQRLAFEMEKLIDKYGLRDQVINLMVTGLIEKDEEGTSKMKALYSYSLDSVEELEDVIDFIYDTWVAEENEKNDEPDLDNLLDGTGIELED